jgi:hypothetical protein
VYHCPLEIILRAMWIGKNLKKGTGYVFEDNEAVKGLVTLKVNTYSFTSSVFLFVRPQTNLQGNVFLFRYLGVVRSRF